MTNRTLQNHYFKWMYELVCNDRYCKRLSYRKLLYFLNGIDFEYTMRLDENRAEDGKDFRYRFGYESGYPRDVIEEGLDIGPCSVLEMMIALAFRIEEDIMDDYDYGNRTGQWFWEMIVSLGLGSMHDDRFSERFAYDVVYRFLNRDYAPNGKGGLFTIENSQEDLRNVEIWDQCMWHLNDV